jgi:hypothetical protein
VLVSPPPPSVAPVKLPVMPPTSVLVVYWNRSSIPVTAEVVDEFPRDDLNRRAEILDVLAQPPPASVCAA